MAEPDLRVSRSDYLTRLAGLTGPGAPRDPDPAELPVILLRPRLPARFEAAPESAPDGLDWSDWRGAAESDLPPLQVVSREPASAPRRGVDPVPHPEARRRAAPPEVAELDTSSRRAETAGPLPFPPPATAPVAANRAPTRAVAPVPAPAAPLPQRGSDPELGSPTPNPTPGAESSRVRVRPGMPAAAADAEGALRQVPGTSEIAAPGVDPVQGVLSHPVLRPRPLSTARESEGKEPEEPSPAAGSRHGADGASDTGGRRAPILPAINVTIGRIDVRAPAALPPPALPRPEPPRPAVSLDEYLQRRSDGRY